jgi:hypothetical protein
VGCGPSVAPPWPRAPPSAALPAARKRGRTRSPRAGPMGHEGYSLMPDTDDIPRRRRVLVLDVTQAAAEVSRLTREAYDLNLPVEPGVRDGRDALVRWAVLLEEVLP